MHYYQHNIGDYRRDTSHLSLLEHGVYRQLLDWHYLSEEPIPRNNPEVFRRLRANNQDEQNAVIVVLKEFFCLSENHEEGYIQRRCMAEIEQYKAKADRAASNGKLGGRPKKTKVVISGLSEITQEKANPLTHKPTNPLSLETTSLVGRPTIPSAPIQLIVDLFNEILPELPAARILNSKRKRETPKFWGWVMTSTRSDGSRRAETFDQGIDFVRSYFERARENDFIMGRADRSKDHAGWQADFDYLISEKGIVQVVEKTR